MSNTIKFLSKVYVKAFAKNEKCWQRLPLEWSKSGQWGNVRIVTRKENKNPENVYTVIGKRQMSEGYTDRDIEYGHLWIQKKSTTVYIVADRLHNRYYALLEDLKLINQNESPWKLETVWVARDQHGNIIRASDTSPSELLEMAEKLKKVGNDRLIGGVQGDN